MASVRPSMHARDSSGRQVSLLNDDAAPERKIPRGALHARSDEGREVSSATSYVSESSSPRTPDLLRSNSYDSRASNDPTSPLTPSLMEYGSQGSYANSYPDSSPYEERLNRSQTYSSFSQKPQSATTAVRPAPQDYASSSYEEDCVSANAPERSGASSGKRYPCRFKESHGCDKSFTTSGHASRHSKIHTAEKAVHCSFQGCQKKFTRADNMKQHLETHYKERSRSAATHRSSIPATSKLTIPAGVKKPSATAGRTSRPSSRTGWPENLSIDHPGSFSHRPPEMYTSPSYGGTSPATSPRSSYGALDMGSIQNALPARAQRAPEPGSSSGLDALAAAVASQIRR